MWDFSIGRPLGLMAKTMPFIALRCAVYFGITLAYVLMTGIGSGIVRAFLRVAGGLVDEVILPMPSEPTARTVGVRTDRTHPVRSKCLGHAEECGMAESPLPRQSAVMDHAVSEIWTRRDEVAQVSLDFFSLSVPRR